MKKAIYELHNPSSLFLPDCDFFPRKRWLSYLFPCRSISGLRVWQGMTIKKRYLPWALILLVLLIVLSLDSIYWLLFSFGEVQLNPP
jgi:hypothetical protein